jgi:PLP dependent protein
MSRTTTLLSAYHSVCTRIAAIQSPIRTRIVLVSKLKPASDILALHSASPPSNPAFSSNPTSSNSQSSNATSTDSAPPLESFPPPIHFGENYVQELLDKAQHLPRSIKWHFIGGLQSNKCKSLAESVPNLWQVSSVDTSKKADLLEKGRAALLAKGESPTADKRGQPQRLRVLVQVNTSGEDSKSGISPADALELCRHVRDHCPHLQLAGLMTIGAIARSHAAGEGEENEDFKCLVETRDRVAEGLGLEKGELELSMGMSADFESAIAAGSGEVRIGSTIFGERAPRGGGG